MSKVDRPPRSRDLSISRTAQPHLAIAVSQTTRAQAMQKIIFAISAIVSLSTTSTMAQQREVIKECAADIRATCGDVPGRGGIRACLHSHLADLTRPCQTVLIGTAAIANECRGDVRAMCEDVEPGGGRIEACLQLHFTELSRPCIDVMTRTVGHGE